MAPRSLRTQDFEVVAKQRDPRALPRDPKKRTSALGLPRCRRVYIESKLWEWISGCWDRGRGLQDTAILAGQANLVLGCLLGYTGSIPPSLLDYQKEQTKCSSLRSTFLYFDTTYDAKLLPHHLSTSPKSTHSRRERLK